MWNIPIACNRASADFPFSSPLLSEPYQRRLPNYETYRQRKITGGDPLNEITEQDADG
jgi:methylglyoxal synthase